MTGPPSDAGKGPQEPGAPSDDAALDAPGGYRVQLPVFEGPLDLLLHLIQKHELDILDIPIGFVTEKYVEYITMMEELSIDVASEYLVMGATLAHIKSKTLLPTPPDDGDDVEPPESDPRAELVRRLLEYQKYKLAAEELGTRSVLGRDVFERGLPAPMVEGPAPLAPVSLFKLLDAFEAVLRRVKQTAEHEIDLERISITERINQLSDVLRERKRVHFDELFDDSRSRGDVIVTFLALLEMTRLRLTHLAQDDACGPILVELRVVDDEGADGSGEIGEPQGGGDVASPEPPDEDEP